MNAAKFAELLTGAGISYEFFTDFGSPTFRFGAGKHVTSVRFPYLATDVDIHWRDKIQNKPADPYEVFLEIYPFLKENNL